MERTTNRLRGTVLQDRAFSNSDSVRYTWEVPIDVKYDTFLFRGACGVELHELTLSWYFIDENETRLIPHAHTTVVAPWLFPVECVECIYMSTLPARDMHATDRTVDWITATLKAIVAHVKKNPNGVIEIDA